MTLNNVLSALSENEMLYIEVIETVETKEVEIIEFDVSGYEALSDELLARTVDKIIINTQEPGIVLGMTIKLTDN